MEPGTPREAKRILILTQALDRDDPALSFFGAWVREFAKVAEKVTVICLRKGDYVPPENVRVLSLGKERGSGKLQRALRFYWYIVRHRNSYDAVFVHMNPEYIVLGGLLWKLLGKRVVLWYVHRSVDLKLRIAVRLADAVVTAAPGSIRIQDKKVRAVGHGIDLAQFEDIAAPSLAPSPVRLITVGRITPIKNPDVMLRVVALMVGRGRDVRLDLVGAPTAPGDEAYARSLRALAEELGVSDRIRFLGPVPSTEIPMLYPRYHVSLNLAGTGGIDKTVLESVAAGVPAITSNSAFDGYFKPHPGFKLVPEQDPEAVAHAIETLLEAKDIEEMRSSLRAMARERVGLTAHIGRLMNVLSGQSSP